MRIILYCLLFQRDPLSNHSDEASSNNNTEGASKPLQDTNVFLALALCVLFVGNLFGNTLVLCVVRQNWKNKKQRVTNTLIANLACIDLSFEVHVIMGVIKAIKDKGGIPFIICQVGGVLSSTSSIASFYTLAVIAIDR